ncbi:hypothetical protein K438DRAFT_1815577 [Mycena galopus ATCC 62051]|nr:hypothetical protein K438DRAFT_1815577 [Mycena galopus ATCC 62051]
MARCCYYSIMLSSLPMTGLATLPVVQSPLRQLRLPVVQSPLRQLRLPRQHRSPLQPPPGPGALSPVPVLRLRRSQRQSPPVSQPPPPREIPLNHPD